MSNQIYDNDDGPESPEFMDITSIEQWLQDSRVKVSCSIRSNLGRDGWLVSHQFRRVGWAVGLACEPVAVTTLANMPNALTALAALLEVARSGSAQAKADLLSVATPDELSQLLELN